MRCCRNIEFKPNLKSFLQFKSTANQNFKSISFEMLFFLVAFKLLHIPISVSSGRRKVKLKSSNLCKNTDK